MLRILCALLIFGFLPNSANAISTASIVNTSCSGDLTSSLLNGASFTCSGNFTLDGGTVTSDSLINISSTGDLFLDNLILTAPNVSFSVLSGILTLGSGVLINANSTVLSSNNSIIVAQSALINIFPGSNNNVVAGTGFPLGGGLNLSAGVTLSTGAGGSGNVFTNGTNLPVAGGTILLGSGGLGLQINSSGDPYAPAIVLAAVPEPSTYAMMLFGILSLASIRRKST